MIDALSVKPTILVVEDERTQLALLTNKLIKYGINVLSATNGKEGVDSWSAHQKDIRIVITDLEMPGADGFELIEHIRAKEKLYTYIIVLTSREDKESLVEGLRAGADDFITKPITTEELVLRLKGARRRLRLQDYTCLVGGLAELAAERGGESRSHLQRTKRYCAILAMELMNDRDNRDSIEQAVDDIATISTLHDIGKNSIPDALLMKRGRLTPKEKEIVRDHTIIGGNILMELYQQTGSLYLLLGHEIALSHHEKWDGTGYPKGLKGAEIPLAARIMCFADVFDSMLSRKPYKDPMPLSFVEDFILEEKGKTFDPEIVACYQRKREEFLEIHNSIKEDEDCW